jgi:hypothetical protein
VGKAGGGPHPYAVIEGDVVTFHQVRNFDYRTEKDFTPRYETRRFDLNKLSGVDLFLNYWGSPYMAHPILSYDFGEDGRICFSIETRPEKGESYSALGGLYRKFELFYVVADERDVVRLRSNFRKGQDVYLYRLKAPFAKASFMEYVRTVNELHERPRWYHAITNNCTAAGRLAAGDPSIWKTVRALKLRPGTLRVRIAGDYRLLFEISQAETLHLTDLILRRDLDRWLAAGGK